MFIVAILTVNGAYHYVRDWYYYIKKRNLYKEYINGFVYKGQYYLPDGTKTKELPNHIPEIKENEIRNMKRIMKRILNAEFPMFTTSD